MQIYDKKVGLVYYLAWKRAKKPSHGLRWLFFSTRLGVDSGCLRSKQGSDSKLVLEEGCNVFVANHLLVKAVGTRLGALYHFDDFRIRASVRLTGLERCDCLFSHGCAAVARLLFDFLVDGHALENRVVLLQLEAFGSVLAILCRDVTASAGHAALFVFGAFEDYLNAITFRFLCHRDMV